MQTELFDITTKNAEAGFRLTRLEVYNWGTFNQHVWQIHPNNANALLTGDIGSGKSTLVDAITTLLVPHHRIIYNKAAGADNKERNLYSYIRGEYKNEKDDFTQSAKAIALRDENNYSVILGYFYNSGFSQGVTLAQIFWIKDNKRNPEKFFVISQKPLTISGHFSGFDSNILNLKKRLRQDEEIELFENFKEYSSRFRHLLGIHNEQALELFYQTVSMKSVGNLTEFVRNHMLEKCDIEQRINELRHNFDNLNRAHMAVLKSKHQIGLLKPLFENIQEYQQLAEIIQELRTCRDKLRAYFSSQQTILLKKRIDQLETDIQKSQLKLIAVQKLIQELYNQESELKANIANNGGQRLQAIANEIVHLTEEQQRKQHMAEHYKKLTAIIDLNNVANEDDFYRNRKLIETILANTTASEQSIQLKQVDLRMEIKSLQAQQQDIENELSSLKTRKNNIPVQMLMLRQELLTALKLNETILPFVGELLQVTEIAQKWEGAIEKLLRNFGISLLVPEKHYAEINRYVEHTSLKGRLIYYRTKMEKSTEAFSLQQNSLVNKVMIKSDSYFYSWLKQELLNRFNYICCEDLDEFRRLPQAMTPNGLIKAKNDRHEKDDRYPLHDRSRYILGWSNNQKITALAAKLQKLQTEGLQFVAQLSELSKQYEKIRYNRDACRDLLAITNYHDLHWQVQVEKIQILKQEKVEIEKTSDILHMLNAKLEQIKKSVQVKSTDQAKLERVIGGQEQQLDDRKQELIKAEIAANETISPEHLEKLAEYQNIFLTNANIESINLANLDNCHSDTRNYIQKQIDNQDARHKRLAANITQQMQAYKHHYPAETQEVDAVPEAASDYVKMLDSLCEEDLPRHEKRFKELLNEGTINSIALFQNQLNQEKQSIHDRLRKINLSLHEIEYSPGTYIELLNDPTQDIEIRDFQQDIRRCLQNTLHEEKNFYDEDKFLQVKALIERFNGREGLADLDQRWTQKVCDVRNWFNFSASERWFADNTEKEFYSDSSGKSGGQKEKLAYTILASALAYQFGLEWGVTQSRSFRFVVIDEAFGKGSNDSTRYGLELFKKLDLQLLIVTPLQKIHIIEDYIKNIHFIENQNGCNSVIRNLTIEEYHQEKHQYQEKMADDLTGTN